MKAISIKKQVIALVIICIISTSQIKAQDSSGFTLPVASDTILGGVKVGDGLKIDNITGQLSLKSIPISILNNSLVSSSLNAGKDSGNPYSTMLGEYAGSGSSSYSGYNNYIGYYAGYGAKGGHNNYIGYEAGRETSGDNTGTIFIGRYAGKKTTSSDGVVFLGGSAGENAKNTTHSCFIAPRAGYQSTNVSRGIYIGYEAGAYSNASYCILIGENAGRSVSTSDKIGNNNIILGNGTTLPDGASNSFNIGNVLYGTGIQQTTGGYPSPVPKADGRVGIGIILPRATLDVNGNMLINGNVGIGTSNPQVKLDVAGVICATEIVTNGPVYGTEIVTEGVVSAANGFITSGTVQAGKIIVDGTITAKEVNVQVDVWSDFVFSPNYKLRPLKDVNLFIKKNGHLPDVPSEKEMIENGMGVAEISAKLLQKIEELTLYVITQNAKLEEQEMLIKDLQDRVSNKQLTP